MSARSTINAMNIPVDISYAMGIPAIQATTPKIVTLESFLNCNRSVRLILLVGLNKKVIANKKLSSADTLRTITAKSSNGFIILSLLSEVSVAILQILIQRKENCKNR